LLQASAPGTRLSFSLLSVQAIGSSQGLKISKLAYLPDAIVTVASILTFHLFIDSFLSCGVKLFLLSVTCGETCAHKKSQGHNGIR
jgi:hypothetical protein